MSDDLVEAWAEAHSMLVSRCYDAATWLFWAACGCLPVVVWAFIAHRPAVGYAVFAVEASLSCGVWAIEWAMRPINRLIKHATDG